MNPTTLNWPSQNTCIPRLSHIDKRLTTEYKRLSDYKKGIETQHKGLFQESNKSESPAAQCVCHQDEGVIVPFVRLEMNGHHLQHHL